MSTPNIEPNAANEGRIGTKTKPWLGGFFNHITMSGVSLRQKIVYTVNSTFVVPAGVTRVYLTGAAGGGGGSEGIGMGGGGGECCFQKAVNVTPYEQISIAIGSGGTAAGYNGLMNWVNNFDWGVNYDGYDGGETRFGNKLTLTGGKTAHYRNLDDMYPGEAGGLGGLNGHSSVSHWNMENRIYENGGDGGGTIFGPGGTGGHCIYNPTNERKILPANNGCAFGSGGGGGAFYANYATNTVELGLAGQGADGILIVEWE